MSDSLDNYELNTVHDYRFFAFALGQKLRNTNFQSSKREVFLKTLLEQIRPNCSLKSYERIQKSINQIAHQKDLQQKQIKAKLKVQSNKRDKKLVNAKQIGRVDKFGVQIQDYQSQQEDEDNYSDEEYAKYEK